MLIPSFKQMPSFKSLRNKKPILKVQDYFNGEISAWGFLQNRKGEIIKKFTVKMTGNWRGEKGTLDEQFLFDDGKTQNRKWQIELLSQSKFIAKAEDVVGKAKGRQEGNAINMKYTLRIPVDEKFYNIKIDDWLILMDEKRLINISSLSKFFVGLGRLTIYFEKA